MLQPPRTPIIQRKRHRRSIPIYKKSLYRTSRHTCTAPHLPWYGLSRTVPGNARSPRSEAEWEYGASVRVKNVSPFSLPRK